MKVCACILHYNQPESLGHLIEAVQTQDYPLHKIIVVDNGSTTENSSLEKTYPDVEFVFLKKNRGVGFGHNTSWKLAIEKFDADFIWSLEHDCLPESSNLSKIIEKSVQCFSEKDIYAVNSIELNDFDFDKFSYYKIRFPNIKRIPKLHKVKDYFGGLCFNGVLIPAHVIKRIGYLREDFFIGCEDAEYTQRIYENGGKVLRVVDTYVYHDLYKKHKKIEFGKKVLLFPNNSPIREYYSFRNYLALNRNYVNFAIKLFPSIIYILLFRGDKFANISSKILGFYDAIRGKLGESNYYFMKKND